MPRKPLWSEPIYNKKAEDERINKSASNVRVNLSIPSGLYDLLHEYAEENCLPSIPSACVQLIRLQLRAQNEHKAIIQTLKYNDPKVIKKMDTKTIQAIQEKLIDPENPGE